MSLDSAERELSDGLLWALRAGWCLAGVTLLWWSFVFLGYSDQYPWMSILLVAATGLGLVVIVASWTSPSGSPHRILGWAVVVLSMVAFLVWCWAQIRLRPAYGTDELAFDQYAAELLWHGHNPYTHSMAPAFGLFHVSQAFATFGLNGVPVTNLSYPSLSFLIYVPFVALGWVAQMANIVNVAAWALTVGLGYLLLPRGAKPLAIVLGSLAVYTGFALGGVTDVLYLPPLMVAVYQWDRFPELRGWRAWVAPLAMGLTLSVKQTPWLILPFLLLGLILDGDLRGDRRTGLTAAWRFLWRAGLTFVVVNLPFIALDPRAWFDGAFGPVTSTFVPEGQGWTALSTFLGIGGGTLVAYTLLFASALVCALVMFVAGYPRTKALVVFMPALIYAFAARSFASYLVMLALPAIVAACSARGTPARIDAWRALLLGSVRRKLAVCASTGLVVIALIVVLAWPPPLRLVVKSVFTNGSSFTVDRLAVQATNQTSQSVDPVFFVKSEGSLTSPWIVFSGPPRLAPGQSARYLLQAPNAAAQQSGYGGFQVVATTTSPPAMSVSAPYAPTLRRLTLEPEVVDTPVAPGVPITFVAQLVDQFDAPIPRAGIPIFFHQVAYPIHRAHAFALINGRNVGSHTVRALTNAQGVARFVVTGTGSSENPIYFSAGLFDGELHATYTPEGVISVVFLTPPAGG